MPFYQRRGELPRKRHIVFRENGALLTEEVMGLEGFTVNQSILYHLVSPCRVKELGTFTSVHLEAWVPEKHAHLLMNTYDIAPEGDEISGRRTLMWNDDVEISLCRPDSRMTYFFRNGEGDEVVFVHEGSGTLETIFGDLRGRPPIPTTGSRSAACRPTPVRGLRFHDPQGPACSSSSRSRTARSASS